MHPLQEQDVATFVRVLTLETRHTLNERLALKVPKQIFKEMLTTSYSKPRSQELTAGRHLLN